MIEGTFDSRTLARMNLALDRVCQAVVDGETHSVRKRVARRIVKCARSGKTSVEELTSAGQRAVTRFARSETSPRPTRTLQDGSPPENLRSADRLRSA